jgi:hypothetical protein
MKTPQAPASSQPPHAQAVRRPFPLPAAHLRSVARLLPQGLYRVSGPAHIQAPAPVTSPRAAAEHLPLPGPAPQPAPADPAPRPAPPEPSRDGHVAGPAEVLQRVTAWVEAGTPRLCLDVGGAFAGRVEVVRTGPGRVRLSWRCRQRGGAGLASQVRAALAQSGLHVEGLRVEVEG